jgi:hypothetical protein
MSSQTAQTTNGNIASQVSMGGEPGGTGNVRFLSQSPHPRSSKKHRQGPGQRAVKAAQTALSDAAASQKRDAPEPIEQTPEAPAQDAAVQQTEEHAKPKQEITPGMINDRREGLRRMHAEMTSRYSDIIAHAIQGPLSRDTVAANVLKNTFEDNFQFFTVTRKFDSWKSLGIIENALVRALEVLQKNEDVLRKEMAEYLENLEDVRADLVADERLMVVLHAGPKSLLEKPVAESLQSGTTIRELKAAIYRAKSVRDKIGNIEERRRHINETADLLVHTLADVKLRDAVLNPVDVTLVSGVSVSALEHRLDVAEEQLAAKSIPYIMSTGYSGGSSGKRSRKTNAGQKAKK